jgi:hypothetical protein
VERRPAITSASPSPTDGGEELKEAAQAVRGVLQPVKRASEIPDLPRAHAS